MNLINKMIFAYEVMINEENSETCRKHFRKEYDLYYNYILNGDE